MSVADFILDIDSKMSPEDNPLISKKIDPFFDSLLYEECKTNIIDDYFLAENWDAYNFSEWINDTTHFCSYNKQKFVSQYFINAKFTDIKINDIVKVSYEPISQTNFHIRKSNFIGRVYHIDKKSKNFHAYFDILRHDGLKPMRCRIPRSFVIDGVTRMPLSADASCGYYTDLSVLKEIDLKDKE